MRLMLLPALLLLAMAPIWAHHSFAAEYDGDKPVTIKGTVTKIDWENPHFHFYLDTTAANGAVEHWKFEGYPPNMLVRQGWKRDVTLKVGDTVSVFAWHSREAGVNLAHSREITWADGKKMQSGPPAGTGGN